MGIEIFQKHIREKRAVSVVSGYNNLDLDKVAKICRAAQRAHASAVDVAPKKEIIEIAKKNTKLPIFASSIHPFEILEAVKAGVDGIEIGGFEHAYRKGHFFNAVEVYDIVLEVFNLISDYDVYKTVTIPVSLNLEERIDLIDKLTILGVDLIQSEGYSIVNPKNYIFIKEAQASINNAREIIPHSKLPIMITCGINENNAKEAILTGADAISIGTIVQKQETEAAMQVKIAQVVSAVAFRNSINREIVRNVVELSYN